MAPLEDLTFLHGNCFPRCVAEVDKYFIDYGSLQLMTAGGIELSYDSQHYRLERRWVWPCYPGPLIRFHRLPQNPYWFHRYVAFRGPRLLKWKEQGLWPFSPQRLPARGDFTTRFDLLIRLFPRTDRIGRLRAVNILEGLLMELADLRRPEKVQWIERAQDAILRLSAFHPDYARAADEMGMALSTFRRMFQKESGMSVHRFLLHRRLMAAKSLLTETRLPLKTVARQLGYQDVFFFSRQFARETGLSPGAFRDSPPQESAAKSHDPSAA